MSTHNLCFRAKKREKNVYPCKPQFYYIKWGVRGYTCTLHRHVIMMKPFETNTLILVDSNRLWSTNLIATDQSLILNCLFDTFFAMYTRQKKKYFAD